MSIRNSLVAGIIYQASNINNDAIIILAQPDAQISNYSQKNQLQTHHQLEYLTTVVLMHDQCCR
jgi:hypothetical protein